MERVEGADRNRGPLARPERAPRALDQHVEAPLEDLVILDLLPMDMRGRRHASRRQDELHLDVLTAGLGSRSPHDVHAAVRHPELVTHRGYGHRT